MKLPKIDKNKVYKRNIVELTHKDCEEILEEGLTFKYKVIPYEEKIKNMYYDKRLDTDKAKSVLAEALGINDTDLIYTLTDVTLRKTLVSSAERGERECAFTSAIVIEVPEEITMSDRDIVNFLLTNRQLDEADEYIMYAHDSYIIIDRNGKLSGLVSGERLGFNIIPTLYEAPKGVQHNTGATYRFIGTQAQDELFRELPDEINITLD